jgi:NAD-dependent aldehyde dehydrogenases
MKQVFPRLSSGIVTGSGDEVGEALARHQDIRALSFTGAVRTGIRVAEIAAPTLKKTILELGGSDAMIVCQDADPDLAAKGAVSGRFFNCGQTCTAIKRVFVDKKISDQFIRRVREYAGALKVGNGLEKGVDMGPVHTMSQRDALHSQVEETITREMATVLCGGTLPDSLSCMGSFYHPTILTDVDPDAPVMNTEVFGPVLPISTFDSLEEAITRANATRFGLGASIWTHDMRIISKATEELKAGIVWVNQHLRIPPEVPFGGTKFSGIGRENGRYALEQYLEERQFLFSHEGDYKDK